MAENVRGYLTIINHFPIEGAIDFAAFSISLLNEEEKILKEIKIPEIIVRRENKKEKRFPNH